MTKEITLDSNKLRQQAEESLIKRTSNQLNPLLEADSLKLMHELEVYHIELDMQNEELIRAKGQDAAKMLLLNELEVQKLELKKQNEELHRARLEAEQLAQKYSLLYDFAPTGYYTLSNLGDIVDLNLCGAQLLNKERSKLIDNRFSLFVSNNTKPFFQLFLDKVFVTETTESCEITLSVDGHKPICVHFTGIAVDNNQCHVTAVDISKRKRAEEELLLKNVIFDTSLAANCITDLKGLITEVNNAYYLMHGFRYKYEVIGKCITDFIFYKTDGETIMASLKNNTQWEGEYIAKNATGNSFVAQGTATVVRDKYGEVVGFQSSIIDVSIQKQAEIALHTSEEKFRSIFENTQDVFFQVDLIGNVMDISPSVKLITGNNRESYIGSSIINAHAKSTKIQSLFEAILNNKKLTNCEQEIKSLSGKSVFVSVNAELISDSQGVARHIDGSMRDITQRRTDEANLQKSKLLLKASIESPKDMIIISVDANYNHLVFNDFYKEVMKSIYHSTIEVGNNLLECITCDEDRAKSKMNLDKALAGTGHITIEEYGKFNRRCFETRYNPIINEKNEIVGASFFAADITERINTERALAESELKYRQLIENSPDAIVIYIDSKIVFANKQALNLIGASDDNQLVGKSVMGFVHPHSREVVMARLRQSSKNVLAIAEEKFVKIDGTQVDVEVRATNIKIDSKDAVQLIIRDITESKQAALALKESEARFRQFFMDLKTVAVQGYAPDGTTTYWNRASELFYGYKEEEAVGKNIQELIIPADLRPRVEQSFVKIAETRQPLPPSELILKRKDGSLIPVLSHDTIVNSPGEPYELLCIDIDITDRIKAEEALRESDANYRFIFENNPHPVFIFDLETLKFLEVNAAAIRHYGYSKAEFLAMTIMDIRPQEDLPALMKDLETVNDATQTITQWRHIKKNKELIFVEVTAVTIKYNGKNARQIMINDITTAKNMEAELVMRQHELKNFAANLQNVHEEERLSLANEIHDELAQTLIAIKIDMGIMKKSLSEDINNITAESFLSNFNNIFSMVDTTINTSRKIMSGLKSEVLELLGFIETVKLYSKEFEERHSIKCFLKIIDDKIELAPLKSIALFRIYQEILCNIATHSQASEVSVFVGVVCNELVFEVTDNGIGFDPDKYSATDIPGFSCIKERVYVLEAKLLVSTKPGKGTTVRVEIPYCG